MNLAEEYEFKRQCFKDKTLLYFRYLIDEFGYSESEYTFFQQKNGAIINDVFTYHNPAIDRILVVRNDYHPYDYGFEIDFYKPSITTNYAKREMVIWVNKEQQDIEQTYLEKTAKDLREKFHKVLSGEEWIT